MDAFRVDLFPSNPVYVQAVVKLLLDWVRYEKHQWWIKHDRAATEGYLRNSFAINELGERVTGEYAGVLSVHNVLPSTKPLTPSLFAQVAANVIASSDPPLSVLTFLDATHLTFVGQVRRAIIESAIACELLIQELANDFVSRGVVSKAAARRALTGTDLLHHLSGGIKAVTMRSFKEEHPEDYERVRQLWIARNNVAHGRKPILIQDGVATLVTPEIQRSLWKAVHVLFEWRERVIFGM